MVDSDHLTGRMRLRSLDQSRDDIRFAVITTPGRTPGCVAPDAYILRRQPPIFAVSAWVPAGHEPNSPFVEPLTLGPYPELDEVRTRLLMTLGPPRSHQEPPALTPGPRRPPAATQGSPPQSAVRAHRNDLFLARLHRRIQPGCGPRWRTLRSLMRLTGRPEGWKSPR